MSTVPSFSYKGPIIKVLNSLIRANSHYHDMSPVHFPKIHVTEEGKHLKVRLVVTNHSDNPSDGLAELSQKIQTIYPNAGIISALAAGAPKVENAEHIHTLSFTLDNDIDSVLAVSRLSSTAKSDKPRVLG